MRIAPPTTRTCYYCRLLLQLICYACSKPEWTGDGKEKKQQQRLAQ